MIFKTFGNTKHKVIVLLHGGGLSWWSCQQVIERLKELYYVVAVVLDGHGEHADKTFVSIEDSSEQLIDFIDRRFDKQVFALIGLSLGAQIVTETISRRKAITSYAIIESALVCPMKLVEKTASLAINSTYWLIKQKWFSNLQAKALFIPKNQYELYYEDSIKVSKQSLINIAKSNASYELKESISATDAAVLIIIGEKEMKAIQQSAQELNAIIPNSKLYIAKKMKHGELSLVHTESYLKLIYAFFDRE